MFNKRNFGFLPFMTAGAIALAGSPDLPSKAHAPIEKRQEAIVRRKRETGKQLKTRKRRNSNREGHRANRTAILSWWYELITKEGKALYFIQSMTNWQNHQWRKAGGKRDLETVQKFGRLVHRNQIKNGEFANV